METFQIRVQELLTIDVEIEANSVEDAVAKVIKQYKEEEIVLDAEDFVEVNFIDANLQDAINNERHDLMRKIIDYLYEDEKRHYQECEDEPQNHIFKTISRLKEMNERELEMMMIK
jgi:predicted transcriptional regulator